MTEQPKPPTRFDIKYNQTPGREHLEVSCNFPDRESGSRSTRRHFFGARARKRFAEIKRLAEMNTSEPIERYIVYELGVGGTGIFRRNLEFPNGHLFKPMTANEVLADLGRLPDIDGG